MIFPLPIDIHAVDLHMSENKLFVICRKVIPDDCLKSIKLVSTQKFHELAKNIELQK